MTAPRTTDDAALRGTIERLLPRRGGGVPKVRAMQREPSPFASLFPAEVVSLSFEEGAELKLFVKQLGEEQADHPEKQCRDREIRIYEELLRDESLPVVGYFGWSLNESSARRDVFLEYVPDWDLRYQELEHWYLAAAKLGELHAHFASRTELLASCTFLLRLDAGYFHEWVERAIRVVSRYDSALGIALSEVARSYAVVAELLAWQPRTLVHNDLAPKNVLVDRARRPVRVALVDWEQAGIGCGVLDLVDLKYGLDAASDERMRVAYAGSLAGSGLLPSDRGELDRLFAACELHRTIHRLAHSASWSLPVETVRRWVAECARLFSLVKDKRRS